MGVKMEVSITKISQNGQVVIPSEIRKDAGIKPSTKFIVFNEDGNILLKQIKKEDLSKDMLLFEKIMKSEDQIKNGKVIKANTSMKDKEIDGLLIA
jgi:AbrB family looped-hinge helix DNA binding protein